MNGSSSSCWSGRGLFSSLSNPRGERLSGHELRHQILEPVRLFESVEGFSGRLAYIFRGHFVNARFGVLNDYLKRARNLEVR